MDYFGITHGEFSDEQLKNWNRRNCSKNWHLFDEVWNLKDHYLVCDACGLEVHVESIDTKYRELI